MKGTEEVYNYHHKRNRREGITILKDERSSFFEKGVGKNNKVLDIGCRDGALTSLFYEDNDVLGIDIDSSALERARQKLGIDTQQVDLNSSHWDIPSDFDVVVAGEVLEHLYFPEKVVERISHRLKPDGKFIGSVPNAFNLKNRIRLLLGRKEHTPLSDPTHINHFKMSELENILKKYFKEVEVKPIGRRAFIDKFWPGMFSFGFLFEASKKK